MIGDLAAILANVDFWAAVLRIATPLVFGTLGVLLCERAGVLNLGIEGIMVAGALAGWLTVYAGGSLWTGVLVAALAGAAFGLLHALLTVTLDMSPGYGYSGIVIAMLARLNPLGVVLAAIFVAGVLVGADSMSRGVAVPTYIADVIVSVALLSMLVATLFARYRVRLGR